MPVVFRPNVQGLSNLLASPQGDLAKNLARRAIRVQSQAKVNASGRPGPRVRTGRLRSSIEWHIVAEPTYMYAVVGSPVKYAIYVEKGTSRSKEYPYLRPALAAAR